VDDEPVAVCTCERNSPAFSETEIRLLRLSCDQAARRLSDLKRRDKWFGARLATFLREKLGKILGFQHTWLKVVGIVIAGLLAFIIFGKAPYRIKSPVMLRTDDVAFLNAPYDGHIEEVRVRVGDGVTEGQKLMSFDQNALLLREAELTAEMNRYESELEKARAAFSTADMRIAQALLEQSAARLDQVRYQIEQSVITAPFDGVIVEGDLIERIGAPVNQGEMLFKLAKVDRLYAELEISERDIHEMQDSLQGEIALTSRPGEIFRIRVFRMEPAAVPKEKGNVFIVHADFPNEQASWWRPGMTGVAKLHMGNRRILWILTHRTVDFLRLRLWL
jgi:RND family efflux transporter MFP subunit